MLSYRHAFHAGNHADVLKHLTLILITQSYCRKDKPFVYFDTHAGAALYSLDNEWARQTGEAESGILRLLQSEAPLSADDAESEAEASSALEVYQTFCRSLYESGKKYPGSPAVVAHFARAQDQLVLMELHPSEIENLRTSVKILSQTVASIDHIHVHHRNGFEGLCSMTPPKAPLPARGFVLIDPSYETDSDFSDVIDTVLTVARRWRNATIAIWYPLIMRRESDITRMKDSFIVQGLKTLCAELIVSKQNEHGLYGSGMLVINPTWHLDVQLEPYLRKLSTLLTVDESGSFSLKMYNEE